MNTEYRFIQPVDTLSIRGNKLFGDPGSHGESLFPPGPSVLSGAFRSLMLVQNGDDLEALPENFAVTAIFPARKRSDNRVEIFLPLPADLVVTDNGNSVHRLEPQPLDSRIQYSRAADLPMLPVLRQDKPAKPEAGWLLNPDGIAAYMQGHALSHDHLIRRDQLWGSESRIGIGLNRTSRTAEEGNLFTVEHIAPRQPETTSAFATGLVVGISGTRDCLPDHGYLRLGGDGRAACFEPADAPQKALIIEGDRFKLMLLTPGIFDRGWLPNRIHEENGEYWLEYDECKARLVCAALPRAEVISGWDLAAWAPKTAERAVPSGSVYWFDKFQGDAKVLGKLASEGLWPEGSDDSVRRAEGFNRFLCADWS
ncbi:MAG: hypothetical protein JXR29_01160 [Methylothermaceae bacterium]|nr:hypothetical protein [Methylothermaceae bacterium]